MSKSRFLTGILSTVFVLTIASSARADMVHLNMSLEKEIYAERHNLTDFDSKRAETGYLYAAHFENNNGKHLGFSVIAHRTGPGLGSKKSQPPTVSQNPEPTAMVLLGTGLAAAAAIARKKNRRRSR
jgi:hypothetical protein